MSTAPAAPVPGVVTGLAAEARCLAHVPPERVRVTGGVPARASEAAAALIGAGAPALLSFGLAGGLDPALAPGALILADRVHAPDGTTYPTDPDWRARVAATLAASEAAVVGREAALATVAEKRALFEATRAAAVDMESHRVAAAAAEAGVPFLVIRAVADPAARALPAAALVGLDRHGRARPFAVLVRLLSRPAELPALIRLAGDARAGLSSLRRAALEGGRGLGFPV